MWYELAPCLLIIGASAMIPQFLAMGMNKLATGKTMRKNIATYFDRSMFIRDVRLTNDRVFQRKGLECIPDKI